jgi:capsid protein
MPTLLETKQQQLADVRTAINAVLTRGQSYMVMDGGAQRQVTRANLKQLQEREPGMSEILPNGWKRNSRSPTRPNAGFGPFRTALLQKIASGAGVSSNMLSSDPAGVNYSSLRQFLPRTILWMIPRGVVIPVLRPRHRWARPKQDFIHALFQADMP